MDPVLDGLQSSIQKLEEEFDWNHGIEDRAMVNKWESTQVYFRY